MRQQRMVMTRIRTPFLLALLAAASVGFAQRGPIDQQLTFAPHHTSGIYDVGETVAWTVTPGPVMPTYAYKWTIRRNNAVVLKEGKLDLSSGKDKIEIAGDQPEMIRLAYSDAGRGIALLVADHPTAHHGKLSVEVLNLRQFLVDEPFFTVNAVSLEITVGPVH